MTGKAHIVSSTILGASLAYTVDAHPLYIGLCIIGGLWPDADYKYSFLGRWVWLWLFFKPHRNNHMHSFIGAFLWTLPFWFADNYIPMVEYSALFFGAGFLLHLTLDLFSPRGIRLFWPSPLKVRLFPIPGGAKVEIYVLFLIYFVTMVYIYF